MISKLTIMIPLESRQVWKVHPVGMEAIESCVACEKTAYSVSLCKKEQSDLQTLKNWLLLAVTSDIAPRFPMSPAP